MNNSKHFIDFLKQLSTAFDDTQTAQLAGDVYGDSLSRQDDLSRLHLGHNPQAAVPNRPGVPTNNLSELRRI